MEVNEFRYDSIDAYLAELTKEPCHNLGRSSRSNKFDLFSSIPGELVDFNETVDLAYKGWPSGAAKARKLATTISEQFHPQLAPKIVWRRKVYGGGSLQVALYNDGKPDCFLHAVRSRETKFVHIVFNGTSSCQISHGVMIKRGVILASMVDALESQNIRVKLDLVYSGTNIGGISVYCYVNLKNFGDSLELDRIVFFTAHPAALRRLYFSWSEVQSADLVMTMKYYSGGNYSTPCDVPIEDQGDIYIPRALSGESQWNDPITAYEFLKSTLTKKGIDI